MFLPSYFPCVCDPAGTQWVDECQSHKTASPIMQIIMQWCGLFISSKGVESYSELNEIITQVVCIYSGNDPSISNAHILCL